MDVMQMAKTLGALYFLLGIIIGLPVLLIMSSVSTTRSGVPGLGSGFGIGMFIILPIVYGALGFIGGAIMAAVYNLVAGWTGGIGIDLESAVRSPRCRASRAFGGIAPAWCWLIPHRARCGTRRERRLMQRPSRT